MVDVSETLAMRGELLMATYLNRVHEKYGKIGWSPNKTVISQFRFIDESPVIHVRFQYIYPSTNPSGAKAYIKNEFNFPIHQDTMQTTYKLTRIVQAYTKLTNRHPEWFTDSIAGQQNIYIPCVVKKYKFAKSVSVQIIDPRIHDKILGENNLSFKLTAKPGMNMPPQMDDSIMSKWLMPSPYKMGDTSFNKLFLKHHAG